MARLASLFRSFLRIPYNHLIRPYLPERIAVYNGVPARVIKIFDIRDTFPDYEEPLIDGIRAHGQSGDTIIHIGGRYGPSAVVSARQVEPFGEVIVYEGSRDYVEKIRETLSLNEVSQLVTVRLAIVGEARDVWGDTTDVETIPPESIPECNLLVLDCEGAEQTILSKMTVKPETLIVETHGELGSPTDNIVEKVQSMEYEIERVTPEAPREGYLRNCRQ